jgi:hypothetical protein
MMHAATSKVENSAQGSSCKLKFVHALSGAATVESRECFIKEQISEIKLNHNRISLLKLFAAFIRFVIILHF